MLTTEAELLKAPSPQPLVGATRQLYFALCRKPDDRLTMETSRQFLGAQLELALRQAAQLPEDLHALSGWVESNTRQVGEQYRQYLANRKSGGPRRYFSSKTHALFFLKSVAPTKLVDGAWLYGLTQHWQDPRFTNLIRIYLEELGEGLPHQNHVVIYKKLLAAHGCEHWENLSDQHFVQGAIQLSLAQHARDFLPEVIGFNLGYEQLPLHLLITAYELNELGIDPYYFTLHITVDNAAAGHARNALQGVFDAMPIVADSQAFFRRVLNGYKLNLLGVGTLSAISQFDLQDELIAILTAKAWAGAHMHSDYCRIRGKTINQWLSDAEQIPAFLDALEESGWIQRHQHPDNSRFWKLIESENAEMFGVFTAYEKQVIRDWIAGDRAIDSNERHLSHRVRKRLLQNPDRNPGPRQHDGSGRGVLRDHFPQQDAGAPRDDFNRDLRQLEDKLASIPTKAGVMNELIKLMSPTRHHTAAGLMATRIFTQLMSEA